jgi:hypothetical protein
MAGLTAIALLTAYAGRTRLKRVAVCGKAFVKHSRLLWIVGLSLTGIILLMPSSAYAQSCALCYTQAASSGARMIQALKSGILILIAPPTFMSIGLFFVCYRKRNQTRDDGGESGLEWEQDISTFDSQEKDSQEKD